MWQMASFMKKTTMTVKLVTFLIKVTLPAMRTIYVYFPSIPEIYLLPYSLAIKA